MRNLHGTYVARSSRIVLTEAKAIEIYLKKRDLREMRCETNRRCISQSRLVAEQYGISPKSVRDIWNQKSWFQSTMHLHSENFGSKISSLDERQTQVVDSSIMRSNFNTFLIILASSCLDSQGAPRAQKTKPPERQGP